MKKFVAAIIFVTFLGLCGCSMSETGKRAELTSGSWSAKLDSGAGVSLDFEGENARLRIVNAGETADISGKYIADSENLVIFDADIGQNYSFEYESKGNSLELFWGEGKLLLDRGE